MGRIKKDIKRAVRLFRQTSWEASIPYRWKNLLNLCTGREISRDEEGSEELDWDIWDYGDHGDAL